MNKKDGVVYHNAFAQTDQYEKPHPTMNHREVQTFQYRTEETQMMREFSSQTPVPGIVIETRKDKVLEAKPYFTSQMWIRRREITALYVQRMIRGWLARRTAERFRKERDHDMEENAKKQEELRKKEEEDHKAPRHVGD